MVNFTGDKSLSGEQSQNTTLPYRMEKNKRHTHD